jgi:hypothetical protein
MVKHFLPNVNLAVKIRVEYMEQLPNKLICGG